MVVRGNHSWDVGELFWDIALLRVGGKFSRSMSYLLVTSLLSVEPLYNGHFPWWFVSFMLVFLLIYLLFLFFLLLCLFCDPYCTDWILEMECKNWLLLECFWYGTMYVSYIIDVIYVKKTSLIVNFLYELHNYICIWFYYYSVPEIPRTSQRPYEPCTFMQLYTYMFLFRLQVTDTENKILR